MDILDAALDEEGSESDSASQSAQKEHKFENIGWDLWIAERKRAYRLKIN